ncbi:hypothetical protein AAG570_004581 [Ranatra chinensis]|uniref:Uncharacterized protein n=1 Tax=Ranatra chinensis TaxID=642074 RepID=A0ABD0Y2Q0_9HEMI
MASKRRNMFQKNKTEWYEEGNNCGCHNGEEQLLQRVLTLVLPVPTAATSPRPDGDSWRSSTSGVNSSLGDRGTATRRGWDDAVHRIKPEIVLMLSGIVVYSPPGTSWMNSTQEPFRIVPTKLYSQALTPLIMLPSRLYTTREKQRFYRMLASKGIIRNLKKEFQEEFYKDPAPEEPLQPSQVRCRVFWPHTKNELKMSRWTNIVREDLKELNREIDWHKSQCSAIAKRIKRMEELESDSRPHQDSCSCCEVGRPMGA